MVPSTLRRCCRCCAIMVIAAGWWSKQSRIPRWRRATSTRRWDSAICRNSKKPSIFEKEKRPPHSRWPPDVETRLLGDAGRCGLRLADVEAGINGIRDLLLVYDVLEHEHRLVPHVER